MPTVNGTEIRVVGMSRSGNHAIIDWILAQTSGRTCFLNCAEPGENPFLWARPLGPDQPGWRASHELDLEAEARGEHSRKDYLVHSYEDVFLGAFRDPLEEARRERFVGSSRRRIDVLILRDPYNLVASRRAGRVGILPEQVAMRVWCQHARQYLGRRSYFTGGCVGVSYNHWATSPGYRRELATRLGLRFDDAAAAHVPACAGGSSFDGVAYDGAAATMPVLERWRAYRHDPGYAQLFTPHVRELSAAAFAARDPAARLPAERLAA